MGFVIFFSPSLDPPRASHPKKKKPREKRIFRLSALLAGLWGHPQEAAAGRDLKFYFGEGGKRDRNALKEIVRSFNCSSEFIVHPRYLQRWRDRNSEPQTRGGDASGGEAPEQVKNSRSGIFPVEKNGNFFYLRGSARRFQRVIPVPGRFSMGRLGINGIFGVFFSPGGF